MPLLILPFLLTQSPFTTGQSLAAEDPPSSPMAYAAETTDTPETPALDAIGAATGLPVAATPKPATMSASLRATRKGTAGVSDGAAASRKEKKCLATAIYFEARGETETGQVAVAQVVLNRTRTKGYPRTICGVVYQNDHMRNACQFSFACDGKPDKIRDKRAWALAQKIAEDVSAGRRQVKAAVSATHYHATYVSPRWAPKMRRLGRVGQHVFYRETRLASR